MNVATKTTEKPPVAEQAPILYHQKYVTNYSELLIALAWAVEIIAVIIGLTISIVVSVSAYNSFEGSSDVSLLDGTSSVLVAGLPFLLIAVVEICKIPLTFAFMAVRHIGWRSLFLFFVIFLCLITFETMLNGFERNFSNLNRAIDSRKNSIEAKEAQTELLEIRRAQIVKFTEDELEGEVDASRAVIDGDYKASVSRIDANTRRALAGVDYGFKPELEAEITRLMTVRDQYYSDCGRKRPRQWKSGSPCCCSATSVAQPRNASGCSRSSMH